LLFGHRLNSGQPSHQPRGYGGEDGIDSL